MLTDFEFNTIRSDEKPTHWFSFMKVQNMLHNAGKIIRPLYHKT